MKEKGFSVKPSWFSDKVDWQKFTSPSHASMEDNVDIIRGIYDFFNLDLTKHNSYPTEEVEDLLAVGAEEEEGVNVGEEEAGVQALDEEPADQGGHMDQEGGEMPAGGEVEEELAGGEEEEVLKKAKVQKRAFSSGKEQRTKSKRVRKVPNKLLD